MSEEVLDEWQIILEQKKVELEACQAAHTVKSCMKCEKLLDCTLRDNYIKAVYDSMSKGKGGGFEF
jgi:sulfur relay (sulfurtransferase) complex TusBCD TusD component (DsrE family)